jgi:hypothetical protein
MICRDLNGVKTTKKLKIKSVTPQYDKDGIIHGWIMTPQEDV